MLMNDLPSQFADAVRQPDAKTLRAWYTPWRYTHLSWLRDDQPLLAAVQRSGELWRRRAYRAWCDRFSLDLHPSGYDGSVWWDIAFADQQSFDRANYLVGQVLIVARNPRESLLLGRAEKSRGACTDDLRWILERAVLLQSPVLRLADWPGPSEPARYGLISVRAAIADSSLLLFPRIALRYRIEHVNGVAVEPYAGGTGSANTSAARCIARLWGAALRRSRADMMRSPAATDPYATGDPDVEMEIEQAF
jgi:hypothetical protein